MKIIGFNLEKTKYGVPLDNGGACLAVDGEIVMMISEERLNREQYSSGFALSINYLLKNNDLSLEDIDLFVASSCLEPRADSNEVSKQLKDNGFNIPESKIKVCDHHLAHAFTAYYPSGFEDAIIMVLDGDGNTLTEKMATGTANKEKYWLNQNDHNSYYVAKDNVIELLHRDQIAVGENGFGGFYRYFTYFCGFLGYRFAGKLMGLSAYGSKRNTYKNVALFELGENGLVKCLLPDADRLQSPKVVSDWLGAKGISMKPRLPEEPISHEIEDIAYLVQRELDQALIHKVNHLVDKTGLKNLCISGGVGLNAVSNRAILDNTKIENIYIQPAAGDSGQCLGNAYYGLCNFDKENLKRNPLSPYLGKLYTDEDIEHVLIAQSQKVTYAKLDFSELVKLASKKLSEDKIIGWFQGRSEIGPRALGNRSILANPVNKEMKNIINARVKHREHFRPFAPSVLEEKADEWFDISIPAPYMIMNARVKQPLKIPSVTHEDGSARLQTVSKEQNIRYHALITEFEKLTNVPVLLNTSFNDNEAIVESPEDAVKTFLRTDIDYLFMGDYFIQK